MNPKLPRCPWVDLSKPDYVAYHDKEWGVPVHDDRKLFEFLTLEAAPGYRPINCAFQTAP